MFENMSSPRATKNASKSSQDSNGNPPEQNTNLPSMCDVQTVTKDPQLPVDVLLLTAKDCEFLACYNELKDPYRCWFDGVGYVYFAGVDEGQVQEKVTVGLLRCNSGSINPGGSLISLQNAVTQLRPKAVISVGICSSLNPEKAKLGDVVVSEKLATYASKVVNSKQEQSTGIRSYVSKRFLDVIKHCTAGWKAPLKNPEAWEIKVHTNGEFLSGPEIVNAEWRREELADLHPMVAAIETEGEGLFTAAFDSQIEWLIVKGVADYADGAQLTVESWSSCASVMAASLVTHILSDPLVFRSWPRYEDESQQSSAGKLKRVSPSSSAQDPKRIKGVQHTAAANAYSRAMKASIKRKTEFQPKLLDIPTISDMKTDDIFTSLLIQRGQKRIEVEEVAGRKERLGSYGQVSGTRVKHSQEIFIRAAEDDSNPTSILLTGKAGIGKTMFCQKLIRDWADDKLFQTPTNAQKPDFKFVYLLTLRQLNLLRDKNLSLQEVLNHSSILDDQCNVDDSVLDYIVSHPEEVLIIIDGYDEYSQQDYIPSDAHERFPNTAREKMPVAAICAKLIQGQILGQSTVMLTSRPDESDKLSGKIHFDRKVEITGFSESEVKEYIERYFRENETMKNTVLEHITKNEDLVSFAHIPVLCALMCSYIEYILKQSNSTDDLPVSMSELYFELFENFERKHNKKKGFRFDEARLDKLSEFAAQLLVEKRFLFNEEDMKKLNLQEDDQKGLIASGVLHCGPPLRSSFSRTTKYFCFTHLTLQEYLAARCFVKRREIPNRSTVPSTVVLQFMAGILSKVKDSNLMEELLNACQRDEHLLKARCLTEYQDKEFAKNHYRQYPVDKTITFYEGINDVDCIAVSFLLDILSTLNEEEATTNRERLPTKQPFLRLRLEVDCANLTLSGVKRISRPLESKLCVVTELKLVELVLDDTECVKCFSALVSLQTLDMSYCDITGAGIASLCESLKHRNCQLTTLHLCGIEITDAGIACLCEAMKHPNCQLTTLHLRNDHITDAGITSLCEAIEDPNCQLTTLHLSDNQITDAGIARLCEAMKHPNCQLTTLHLRYNHITNAGITSLCEAIKHPNCQLTTLDLQGKQVTDAGIASMCEAIKHPNCRLTTLHLRNIQITDAGIASLCEATKHPTCRLTTLHLHYIQITDAGIASLCEAMKHPNCQLTTLHLSYNQITDAGVTSLCEAIKHPNCQLTTLDLSLNQITDAGIASLCEATKHPNCQLTTLDLSSILITDAGIACLCEAIRDPNCQLTTLHLSFNKITDASIASLCEAIKHPNCQLTTLDLKRNKITDAGITSLCEAIKHPNCQLTTLRLANNEITDAGIAMLCEAIKGVPNCKLTELDLTYDRLISNGMRESFQRC